VGRIAPHCPQTLPETVLEVTGSDSAGGSLLNKDGKRFYWPAIAGIWKPHVRGGTPRGFGPCGDVLDRNIPLLVQHPELRYTHFQPVSTPPVDPAWFRSVSGAFTSPRGRTYPSTT
jgi:hypothetical protein